MKPIFQEHQCLSEGIIQGYLSNRLSEDERHRVENHLLDCPFCADAVEGYEYLAADQKVAGGKKQVRLLALQWRYWAAAAVLLALIAAALWIYPGAPANERLYTEYYRSYDNDLDFRFRQGGEAGTPADTPLTRGLQAYMAQDFAGSADQLEAFLKEFPDNQIARFYLGLALVEQSRWAEALPHLETVQNARREYWEEASWYLALASLRTGDKDAAQKALEPLILPGSGRYYEQATKLAGKL
jgi:hypothetical protein